jgi:hypothetical protein
MLLAVAFFAMRDGGHAGVPLRDFEAYYAAGAAVDAEDDPYSRQIWRSERTIPGVRATHEEVLPFVGPPFGLPLWAAFARVDYATASRTWLGVLALSFGMLCAGSLRLASPRPTRFEYACAFALGGAFGPLTSGLALGQVAVVACAAAVITQMELARGSTPFAAAAALVSALQPNIAIASIARLPERRAFFALAIGAVLAIGLSIAALGSLDGAMRYVAVLREHAAAESGIAIQATVGAIAAGFGANANVATLAWIAVTAGVCAALVALFATRGYGGLERFAIVSAAVPLALPFAHVHDLAIAFFPALYCARRLSGAAWMAAACASTVVAVNWLALAEDPASLPQALCLCTAAALALAAVAPPSLGMRRLAPLAVVALVAVAAPFAAAHPLPLWPDALPADFHADHAVAIGEVWRREQAASGIARHDAVWATLRALSLAGCAALACAAAAGLAPRQRAANAAN